MFQRGGPTFFELLRQGLSSTDRGYDLLAPKFDRTPFRTPDEFIDGALSVLPERFGPALDVACGTGAGLKALMKRSARAVGVDRSRGMLRQAPGLRVQGDALALPFPPIFASCSSRRRRRRSFRSNICSRARSTAPCGCATR